MLARLGPPCRVHVRSSSRSCSHVTCIGQKRISFMYGQLSKQHLKNHQLQASNCTEILMLAGGGPEDMAALLEGESLFNDASAIVLFDIFLQARSMLLSRAMS